VVVLVAALMENFVTMLFAIRTRAVLVGAAVLPSFFAAVACRSTTQVAPARAAEPAAAPAAAAPPDANVQRSIAGTIKLTGSDATDLKIDLTFSGPPADLAELTLTSAAHGAIAELTLSDHRGSVPFALSQKGEAAVVILAREVTPPLTARYTVTGRPADFDDAVATTVGPDRVRISGETALLLPPLFDRAKLSVSILVDLGAMPRASVASSFGRRHPEKVNCTGAELRHATFLGGKMATSQFETPAGVDEWAWLEELGFDARPVSGEFAALRSEVTSYFEAREGGLFTTLALAEVRPDGRFSVIRRTRGLLVQLSVDTGWSAPVRIVVAREIFRPWFGEEVRLVGADGRTSMRELWFNEGAARALARELVFRLGAVTPEEYRVELNDLVGAALLSPHGRERFDALVDRAERDVTARQYLMARGALYFTSIGAALNLKHRTSRGIDGVVRELFALTRSRKRPLALADWLEVVKARLGDDGERAYRRIVEEGQIPTLASASLGPCFRLGTLRYSEFLLGFDLPKTRAGDLRNIVELDPKGPAARAGLRASDRFVNIRYREGQSNVEAEIDVVRDDKRVTIRYLPQGRSQVGPAWLRRHETPDAACQY
jgi:hypothetical protein